MDPNVLLAMAKWPDVPACHGWLGLDVRGDWFMRDDTVQAQGGFPAAKGSRIVNEALVAFIGRNYASDAQGRWFFQNGPQRVYVALEAAPYVLMADGQGGWLTHTGVRVHDGVSSEDASLAVSCCWLDDQGRLFAQTPVGFAVVRSADMLDAAQALEEGRWPEPQVLPFAEMPGRFGYVLDPRS